MTQYKIINKNPTIGFSNDKATIYKMIEMDGEIERKTNLYGYCVAIITGAKGLNWVISNNHLGFLEVYWSRVDWESPKNIEMIADILKKRSDRNTKDILSRASALIATIREQDFERYKGLGVSLESRALSVGDKVVMDMGESRDMIRLARAYGSREKALAENTIISAIENGDHDLFKRAERIYDYLKTN